MDAPHTARTGARKLALATLAAVEALAALGVAAAAVRCDRGPGAGSSADMLEEAAASPNASILPGPLAPSQALGVTTAAPGVEAGARGGAVTDGGARSALESALGSVAPEVMRGDQALDADPFTQHELVGLMLEGEWRYPDAPPIPKAAEANALGVEAAHRATNPRWILELAELGRMRVQLSSKGFPIEQGAELRARVDRYGHVLVWPDASAYRVLPPGTMRALLNERRVDVSPLVRASAGVSGEGPRRLGFATRRFELTTRTGKVTVDEAKIGDAGAGGVLLCRLLTELVSVDPETAPCAIDEVPLRALYTWPSGGTVAFEITSIVHRADLAGGPMLVPPQATEYLATGLPPSHGGVLLGRDQTAAFRTRPAETTPGGLGPASAAGAGFARAAVSEGLVVRNGTDSLRYVLVDGVAAAWATPGREEHITGLPRGRYLVQWRTFLADVTDPAELLEVPNRSAVGSPRDGGVGPAR